MDARFSQEPVRISIPAKVAFDLGAFTKVVGNLARALGCEECLSGRNCVFLQQSQFVVNPETLEVGEWFGFPR
jgi:hypothetical protein